MFLMSSRRKNTGGRLAYGVGKDDGNGHDGSNDHQAYLEYLLEQLPALNSSQTLLLEEGGTIFLMMVVMMMFHSHNYFRMLTSSEAMDTRMLVAENHSTVV